MTGGGEADAVVNVDSADKRKTFFVLGSLVLFLLFD